MRTSGLDGNTAGLQSAALLPGSVGSVEVRFNTVTQDLNRIDGLLQLTLQSQTNPGTFMGVDFFGGSFSTHRTFNAFGSFVGVVRVIDNGVGNPGAYVNDTWYRFRIESTATTLTGSLLADDSSLIASYTFPYALSTLGSDFRVRIAQFGIRQQDVAVDWIRAVPSPGAAGTCLIAGALLLRRRRA